MITARLLVELGCQPLDAINRVRGARPGAIATDAQEKYVQRQRAVPEPYEGMQLALLDDDPDLPSTGAWSAAFGAATRGDLQGLPSQRVRTQGVTGDVGFK
jgi:hypothetical protein